MPTNPKSILALEATEAVIARDGFANFTIDAVATQAGLSKGGVLHHFGSKDALIRALVLRGAEQWKANCAEALELASEGPARFARGILEFYLSDKKSWSNERKSVACAYLAALSLDPELIEPIKAVSCNVHEQFLDNDIPVGLGLVIISALDGLWMSWALGLNEYNEERNRLLLQTLRLMVEDAISDKK